MWHRIITAIGALALLAGCEALNPQRPTPQPDANVFGQVVAVSEDPSADGVWQVQVSVGLPRSLAGVKKDEGKPTPIVDEALMADVSVGPDTVVVIDGRPGSLHSLKPGSDIAAIPAPGTTMMEGTSRVMIQAAYFLDFESYRRWQLPKSLEESPEVLEDPDRINSSGIEHGPVPVDDGRAVYFTAKLRRSWRPEDRWIGARRSGMTEPSAEKPAREASYRCSLGEDGWGAPQPVVFPELPDDSGVSVTWVDPDETRCLVTVLPAGGEPWVGRSDRTSASAAWAPVQPLPAVGEGDASDAVYLTGAEETFAFVTRRDGTSDIYLYHPRQGDTAQALDPRIDTAGNEWAPRVGPGNELLFCRGDRQLMYSGGVAQPMTVKGPFRTPITEANPTRDGSWVFACVPKFTPIELDRDIVVMRWDGEATLGEPVPVDDWRPDGD